jgi:hypothetical protein
MKFHSDKLPVEGALIATVSIKIPVRCKQEFWKKQVKLFTGLENKIA